MRIVLISIACPPKRDPESLQVAKYCKYLTREDDVRLEVVTSSSPTLFMEHDEALKIYSDRLNVACEIDIFENKYLNYIIRKIYPDALLKPDSKYSFWWRYKEVLQKVARPDILYSRSYPVSSTLMALELKKKWNVPWVLHLSDPWAVGSTESLSPATHLVGRSRSWNKRKEEECLGLADKICLTSHKTIELYKRHYPDLTQKFVYMPNVYDDELSKPNPYKMHEKLTFVYTGGFGEARSPYSFLEAIRMFWDKHATTANGRVQFLFTGEMTRSNTQVFEKYLYIPLISHLGVIPYDEMLTLQKRADILVNIDSNIKDSKDSVFLPSKLLDYMIARRRVLAITNKESTTFQVVQNNLGECFEFDETERLSDHLFNVFSRFVNKDESYFYNDSVSLEFSAEYNAKRLADLLAMVFQKKPFEKS